MNYARRSASEASDRLAIEFKSRLGRFCDEQITLVGPDEAVQRFLEQFDVSPMESTPQ